VTIKEDEKAFMVTFFRNAWCETSITAKGIIDSDKKKEKNVD